MYRTEIVDDTHGRKSSFFYDESSKKLWTRYLHYPAVFIGYIHEQKGFSLPQLLECYQYWIANYVEACVAIDENFREVKRLKMECARGVFSDDIHYLRGKYHDELYPMKQLFSRQISKYYYLICNHGPQSLQSLAKRTIVDKSINFEPLPKALQEQIQKMN